MDTRLVLETRLLFRIDSVRRYYRTLTKTDSTAISIILYSLPPILRNKLCPGY